MASYKESETDLSAQYGPDKEPYSGARILSLLPKLYGKKGLLVVNYFKYFRWVDDMVDESELTQTEKLDFIKRQMDLARGDIEHTNYHPVEEILIGLPISDIPYGDSLRAMTQEILASFTDDIQYAEYNPRSEQQLRLYNIRSLLVCLEMVGLIINERPIRVNDGFVELVNAWNTVGALRHFKEDLEQGLIRLSLIDEEFQLLDSLPTPNDRKQQAISMFDKKRFKQARKECESTIRRNLPSIFELDMPIWQKIVALLYMSKVIIKTKYLFKHPQIT